MTTKYLALVGLNYPGKGGERRAEAGDVVDDLPPASVAAFLADGAIQAVAAPGPTKTKGG